jgi:2'-5' RNA ligase
MIRTFIAVEISPEVLARAAELSAALRPAGADVKWVETHNLHLTVKFLGDVQDEQLADVIRAVQGAAAKVEPFELEVHGAGAFPNAGRPRTIWLGARDGSEAMADLAAAIEKALKPLGFSPEHRRFQPHLTIGRVREVRRGLKELSERLWQFADFAAGRTPVEEAIVFSSDLTPRGPIYQRLGTAALGCR